MYINIIGNRVVIKSHLSDFFELRFNSDNTFDLSGVYLIDFNSEYSSVLKKIEKMYHEKAVRRVILDSCYEGQILFASDDKLGIGKLFNSFFASCPDIEIFYITQNIVAINQFNEQYSPKYKCKAVVFNYIIKSFQKQMAFVNSTEINKFISDLSVGEVSKPYRILCLNNIAKSHRLAVCSVLHSHGLIKSNLISFLGKGFTDNLVHQTKHIFQNHINSIDEFCEYIKHNGYISLPNESIDMNPRSISELPRNLYDNSVFSIVTESDFTNGNTLRVTEKLLKTIACGHNFFLLGNPKTLSYLETMGFNFASDEFSSEYDNINCQAQRFDIVMDKVLHLMSCSDQQFKNIISDNKDLLVKNILNFGHTFKDYGNEMQKNLIKEIKDFF